MGLVDVLIEEETIDNWLWWDLYGSTAHRSVREEEPVAELEHNFSLHSDHDLLDMYRHRHKYYWEYDEYEAFAQEIKSRGLHPCPSWI